MSTDCHRNREAGVGRRADARLCLMLPASLRLAVAEEKCRLQNISRGGALVQIEDVPPVGSAAIFKFMELSVLCTVVWAGKNVCGLQFDEALPNDTVLGLRAVHDDLLKHEQAFSQSIARAWAAGEV